MSDTPKGKKTKTQKQLQQEVLLDLEGEPITSPNDKTFTDYRRDYKVPLTAYNLVKSANREPIKEKEKFKDAIGNWIRTWRWVIENENDELRDRALQIYRSLKESIIDVMPRWLTLQQEWYDLVIYSLALQYDPMKDYDAIRYFFWFLEKKFDDIDIDWTINKEEFHKKEAQKVVDSIKEDTSGGSLGL